jgi:molybdopterin-synthase adenylyltransferase
MIYKDRYSRQLLYKNIGNKGQEKIRKASVCIIGVGALGTACGELLTRAGVGKLTLIDRDIIEINNLQRQLLFDERDIGKSKSMVAKNKLSIINSEVEIVAYKDMLSSKNISSLIKKQDVVLGCTDNLISRFLLNDYCKKNNIPFVSGMVAGDRGYVFNVLQDKPCFSCVFGKESCLNCNEIGIINSASTVISGIMAKETIKIILRKTPERSLLYVNIWDNTITKIKVKKKKTCNTCNKKYEYLNTKNNNQII